MRRLISLQRVIDQAREDGTDLRDLAIDEDDVISLDELEDYDDADNPDDDEE